MRSEVLPKGFATGGLWREAVGRGQPNYVHAQRRPKIGAHVNTSCLGDPGMSKDLLHDTSLPIGKAAVSGRPCLLVLATPRPSLAECSGIPDPLFVLPTSRNSRRSRRIPLAFQSSKLP